MTSARIRLGLLLAAAAAVYLLGNGRTPLFDRDEPRYAQCSRQMLQSGDWVVPRLYDRIRAAKPPGIYWCQATAMTFLGDTPFAARLPSSCAAVLTALLLAVVIGREVDSAHALWTAFVFTSSALLIWSAKICLTDSVLLLCTTTALVCTYALWQRRGGWRAVIGLAIATACGGLVKGPFILGVLGATVILLGVFHWWDARDATVRSTRLASAPAKRGLFVPALQIVVGVVILIALVSPWLYLVQHRAPEFLGAAQQDALHHLESGSEGHKAPPGYHLLLIWVTFLPWSLLLPLSIVLGFKNRREAPVRFALASVLGTWIFVEIVQTKLPHYILSAFPGLAFLTADAIVRCLKGEQKDLTSREIKIGSVIIGVVFVGIATVPSWWLSIQFHDFPWAALVSLTVVGVVVGAAICSLFLLAKPRAALLAMGIGAWVFTACLFGVYLPQSQPLRLPIRVADVLKAHDAVHPHQAVMFEYKEPSLGFYQGGTIREYDFSLAQFALGTGEPSWIVTTRAIWDQAPPQVHDAFEVLGEPVSGFFYSDGFKVLDVIVLHRKQRVAPDTNREGEAPAEPKRSSKYGFGSAGASPSLHANTPVNAAPLTRRMTPAAASTSQTASPPAL